MKNTIKFLTIGLLSAGIEVFSATASSFTASSVFSDPSQEFVRTVAALPERYIKESAKEIEELQKTIAILRTTVTELQEPGSNSSALDSHTAQGSTTGEGQQEKYSQYALLQGTDTDVLLQCIHTGDIQPYIEFLKTEVADKASVFIDSLNTHEDFIDTRYLYFCKKRLSSICDKSSPRLIFNEHTKSSVKKTFSDFIGSIDSSMITSGMASSSSSRGLVPASGDLKSLSTFVTQVKASFIRLIESELLSCYPQGAVDRGFLYESVFEAVRYSPFIYGTMSDNSPNAFIDLLIDQTLRDYY